MSRVAVHLAGFTHAQADGLRKIMSKKDKTLALGDYHTRFEEGAGQKGISRKDEIRALVHSGCLNHILFKQN